MRQTSLFDIGKEPFKLTKPIALIELFAGYGSQHLAFKYLGAKVRSFKICEWAVPSIEAYNNIHVQDYTDYSKSLFREQLVAFLADKGISTDYNKPLNKVSISRKPIEWIRRTYNNIIATNNTVDVTRTYGKDFFMRERERERMWCLPILFPVKTCRVLVSKKALKKEAEHVLLCCGK